MTIRPRKRRHNAWRRPRVPLPGPPDEAGTRIPQCNYQLVQHFHPCPLEQRDLVYNAFANNEGWTATVDQEPEL